jgi:asparagine synthase (glutamine-hydrolysing)
MAAPLLPAEITARRKRPYRAPIHRAFFPPGGHDYVNEILSPEALRAAGLFAPAAVGQLVAKLKRGARAGETDDMALAGILSTQLVHRQFVERFRMLPPLSERDNVKVVRFSREDASRSRSWRNTPHPNGNSERESEIISINAL